MLNAAGILQVQVRTILANAGSAKGKEKFGRDFSECAHAKVTDFLVLGVLFPACLDLRILGAAFGSAGTDVPFPSVAVAAAAAAAAALPALTDLLSALSSASSIRSFFVVSEEEPAVAAVAFRFSFLALVFSRLCAFSSARMTALDRTPVEEEGVPFGAADVLDFV